MAIEQSRKKPKKFTPQEVARLRARAEQSIRLKRHHAKKKAKG